MVSDVESSRKEYRGRLEIVRDILSVVGDGCRKTHIMYRANLSYKLLKNYLEYVSKAGLVEFDGEAFYSITEKGRRFLDLYENYEEMYREVNERVNCLEEGRRRLEEMLLIRESS